MWSYLRATIWMAIIAAAVTAGYHYGTALDPHEQNKLGEKCVRDAAILQTNRVGPQQIMRVHASKFFIYQSVEVFLILSSARLFCILLSPFLFSILRLLLSILLSSFVFLLS